MDRDTRLGPVPDTASRRVEDAAQTHRVVGVGHHPQVGHHIPNLFALIEFGTADHLVRYAVPHKDLFEGS